MTSAAGFSVSHLSLSSQFKTQCCRSNQQLSARRGSEQLLFNLFIHTECCSSVGSPVRTCRVAVGVLSTIIEAIVPAMGSCIQSV